MLTRRLSWTLILGLLAFDVTLWGTRQVGVWG